ncbi:uncharacterized protein LOC122567998 [Bombus pyrosoma]|uniref:uncharacterized protein LOC122567998 n=1 Tax=Bombus pyrosoma TaxID=396416 RepID=UPI001CB8CC27|nr:uncharacterized protein LOC122567998 [Bombus pyrosoma]
MSPIPPVLMLWLLLVSLPLPPAEAGEMMDLFALIRGTLKYWRRIYQMYEEEVALGYCWAEYFLHHEEHATNATIPSSQSIDPSNFLPAENDGFEKEHWNHWGVIAIENRGPHYRSKRSYAIQSSTKKEGMLDTLRNSKTMYSRTKQKYKSRWNGLESNFRRNGNNRSTSCANFPKNAERKLAVLTAGSGKETLRSTKERGISKTRQKNYGPCSKNMENVAFQSNNLSELRSNSRFAEVSSNLANRTRIDSRGYDRNKRSYRTHNFKKKDEISKILNKHVRASSKDWIRSIEFPIDTREYSYSERSRETLNSTREKEILEDIGARDATPIEKSVHIVPNVSLGSSVAEFEWNRKNSISRSATNNGPANFGMKSVASKLISKVSRKNSKTTEWNVSVKKSATFDTHSRTDEAKLEANVKTRNPENDDPVKYERFPRNAPRRSRRFSEISNSVDANIEETSKIAGNAFARELASWNTRSKTSKTKFKSNELCSSSRWKDIDLVTDRIEEAFSKDTQHDYSALANKRGFIEPSYLVRNSNVNKFSNASKSGIFEGRKEKKLAVEDQTSDVRWKTSKVKVWSNERRNAVGCDSRSINCVCQKGIWLAIVDDVGGVSLLVPSSSTKEQPENREDRSSPREKTEKMARMDAEFKRTRAEGDLSRKSENLRVDRRRKLLFSKTNRVTSGTLSRLQPSKRSRSLPLGEIASLNRRFKNTETSKRVDNSRKPSDVFRLRNFGPSNLAFRNTEQRPGTWWDNYQRNLRRKRDANDRTRSRLVRPPSKSKRASFYNPMTLREIARFGARYATSNYDVWTNGVKNLSRSEEGSWGGNAKELYPKETVYRSKRYQDSGLATSRESPIVVEQAENGLFRVKSESKNWKWLQSRKEWNSSKRSSTTNDNNRYRRNEHGYIVETSVTERTGKKSAARYPEGGPSLLPVTYRRFMGDYGSRSSRTKDQGRRSSMAKVETRETNRAHDTLFYFRQVFMGFLRTLGFFMNVGRQLMDYVDSNSVLACTKDYLLGKAIHWIDS